MKKLNRVDIKKLRGDLSPFLIHLTRNGTYRKWKDIHNLPKDDRPELKADKSLRRIIQDCQIEARSPFGYFNYKVKYKDKNIDSKIQRHWLKATCFTETPVEHIHVQFQEIAGRQCSFQKYGLAFFEEAVREKNGNPIMYFNTKNDHIRNSLDVIPISDKCEEMKHLLPFYEGFGPPLFSSWFSPTTVDFRWEREWRVVGNFKYSLKKDVAFGICPYSKIEQFKNLVSDAFPFIDPSPQYLGEMKRKLGLNEKLKELI